MKITLKQMLGLALVVSAFSIELSAADKIVTAAWKLGRALGSEDCAEALRIYDQLDEASAHLGNAIQDVRVYVNKQAHEQTPSLLAQLVPSKKIKVDSRVFTGDVSELSQLVDKKKISLEDFSVLAKIHPLHVASYLGDQAAVEALMNAGCNLCQPDAHRNTVLHLAAKGMRDSINKAKKKHKPHIAERYTLLIKWLCKQEPRLWVITNENAELPGLFIPEFEGKSDFMSDLNMSMFDNLIPANASSSSSISAFQGQ